MQHPCPITTGHMTNGQVGCSKTKKDNERIGGITRTLRKMSHAEELQHSHGVLPQMHMTFGARSSVLQCYMIRALYIKVVSLLIYSSHDADLG